MRQSVSDLLCRVGRDSPHYIIYPAIVGASKHLKKKDAFSGMEDSCCREHIFELFIQPHFSKLRCQSSVNHINLLYNFLICLLVCFFYCFGAGVLCNDRDNSDDDGDGGYDNPVQDHMSDQYSPPDAPLNAPVDPGQQNTTCCICIYKLSPRACSVE